MKYIFLTKQFYEDFANCTEIEQKIFRPYAHLKITIDGVDFAVPLRSHINHPHVHWTDKNNCCGLDFSKTVVITTSDYINTTETPYLRPNEFRALKGKDFIIKEKLKKYIEKYKTAKADLTIPRNKTLYTYSTLKYFEEYL